MAFANNMSRLLDKIENRLGTKILDLPEHLQKNKWADEVIINDTIRTWSRYYPYEFRYTITPEMKKKDGWYLLDEGPFSDVTILGVRNIDWGTFNSNIFGVA